MLFSGICLCIQLILWWTLRYNLLSKIVKKENILKLVNSVIETTTDILPVVLLVVYHNPICMIFLLMNLVADKYMESCVPIGSFLFFINYINIYYKIRNEYGYSYNYHILAFCIILLIVIVTNIFWKADTITKIAGTFYSSALIVLLESFFLTKNFGFILLIIGDVLLIWKDIIKNKSNLVYTISNSFYYAGMCFVPVFLSEV